MKKILLVILFTMISLFAFSQSNGEYNYSFGVRGYNYTQMPLIFNHTKTDTYLTSYFNSYIVKFNDNLWSYRLDGSNIKKNVRLTNDCDNCDILDGEMKDFAFKLGFEKNFNYAVIQPYFAFDLGYRSNKFEGLALNASQASYGLLSSKDGFTITPSFGLKINPVHQVSLFAESNFEWFYSSTSEEKMEQNESNTSISKFKKGEFLLNPITIGVQFHLDAKN